MSWTPSPVLECPVCKAMVPWGIEHRHAVKDWAQVNGAYERSFDLVGVGPDASELVRQLDSAHAELSRHKATLRRVLGLLTELQRIFPEVRELVRDISV